MAKVKANHLVFTDAEVVRILNSNAKATTYVVAFPNELNKGHAYVNLVVFADVSDTEYDKGDKISGKGHLIVDDYKKRYTVKVVADEVE